MKDSNAKHWYWEYVVKDWIVDTEPLAELSRAFWHEALCRMWLSDRCGQLVGTYTELAKLCRSTPNNARAAIADLQKWNTADVTISNAVVTVTNRRMNRDYLDRKSLRERVARHRDKKREHDGNASCNGDVTPHPYTQPNPQPQNYPNQGGSGRAVEVEREGSENGAGNMAMSLQSQLAILDRSEEQIDAYRDAGAMLKQLGVFEATIPKLLKDTTITPARIDQAVAAVKSRGPCRSFGATLATELGHKAKRKA
jgi:hypothetical protein